MNGILDHFPGVEYSFAYGSAARPQKNASREKLLLDLVLAVQDPEEWHRENLQRNPRHYAFVPRMMGAHAIAAVQRNTGAGIYYNTGVSVGEQRVKYGVIGTEELKADLLDWTHLYVAGRMQKPVATLKSNALVEQCQTKNLISALRTALLLTFERFTLPELYINLCNISYLGDFRNIFRAENPAKVENIVHAQLALFEELYEPIWKHFPHVSKTSYGEYVQDASPQRVEQELLLLPKHLKTTIVTSNVWSMERERHKYYLRLMGRSDGYQDHLRRGLVRITRYPSFTQAAKGVLSAGLGTSAAYALRKLRKGWARKL